MKYRNTQDLSDGDVQYVEAGHEFDEVDYGWKHADTLHHPLLFEAALQVVGRRTIQFGSKKERSRWNKVDRAYEKNKLKDAWIDNCFEWAKAKNSGGRPVIGLDALMSLLMNPVKQEEFIAKQKWAGGNG